MCEKVYLNNEFFKTGIYYTFIHQNLKYHTAGFNAGHLSTLFVSVSLSFLQSQHPSLFGSRGLSSFPLENCFKLSADNILPLTISSFSQ